MYLYLGFTFQFLMNSNWNIIFHFLKKETGTILCRTESLSYFIVNTWTTLIFGYFVLQVFHFCNKFLFSLNDLLVTRFLSKKCNINYYFLITYLLLNFIVLCNSVREMIFFRHLVLKFSNNSLVCFVLFFHLSTRNYSSWTNMAKFISTCSL